MPRLSLITLFFLLYLGTTSLQAQDNFYNAIGARGGNPSGVTYKQFIGRFSAIEGIAGVNFADKITFTVTGLYEYHIYITEGWNLFAGGGLTVGGAPQAGRLTADAIVGIGYTPINYPVNFSLDYKPYFNPFDMDNGYKGFGFNEGAISIRYVIQ